MTTVESFSLTPSEGEKIHAQKWLAEGSKAIVILVHGLGEHIGRYEHVAKFFNENGISLYGFDHRGHGKSTGKRGHIASNDQFMTDIDSMIKIAKTENPEKPLFLYGHSLGGNMVLFYAFKNNPSINGIICTSPGLGSGEIIPAGKLVAAKILKVFLPSLTMNNRLDVSNLSRDQQVITAYKEDPLVHPMISAKLAMDMFANGDWVIQHAENFPLPLLLLAGSDDHIISLDKINQFAKNVPENLIKFEILPNFFHELHNDFEKEKVLSLFVEWISENLS